MTRPNEILLCPTCGGKLGAAASAYRCGAGHVFAVQDGIIDLTPPVPVFPTPAIYADPDYQKWTTLATPMLQETYQSGSLIERIQDDGHRRLEARADAGGLRLDLGCGFGRHFDFARNHETLIGLDGNLTSLKIAKRNHPDGTFIKGAMEKLPFASRSLAVVYAIFSLEHVYHLDAAVKEIKRVLSPGGQLLVGLPAEGGLMYNTLRRIFISPRLSRKYGIDYAKVVAIEHCNTARQVIDLLDQSFSPGAKSYRPAGIRTEHLNLTITAEYRCQ